MNLKLSSTMLWWLLGIDIFLIGLNVIPDKTRIVDDLFNLDYEANFAVWYSSTKLFVLAVLVLAAAGRLPEPKWSLRLTAVAFLSVSISETALVHERLFGVAYTILKGHEPTAGMPGGWIVYFAPVVVAVLACVVICVFRLSKRLPGSRPFLFSGLALWVAVLFSELAPYLFELNTGPAIHPWQLIEESCEVLGTTAFLGGFMRIFEAQEASLPMIQT